ncbi:N-acetylmuramoyl-L-alanine amidase family protein [Sulfobacillus thermosulfidooxidans]|uniref:N-acetylmuramoyl-L-alanine amidase family protein n=1 Tax=Sulfobacillus thermosulfidooxidans TaxID=28034 RepID=UPI00096B6D86|nr:N-acetylmuramoyl-L-alanine amidase [Sulfobacillus thermosulfidooxidans]OLZ10911.1 cell wall hydrolase [Sulfobacillus thermosulfidooxidans]OLZ14399.1 cell wall hydrolase [Sulfobacillus thermosulfidooxidans]OLZ19142.1 cell wall hydrolase [Sulfobacillus thermosulfidooxidans]
MTKRLKRRLFHGLQLACFAACSSLLLGMGDLHAALAPANGIEGALLRGRTIVIDPGHGGYDPGARGRMAREDEINLAIALDLRKWFEDAGARVLMTWEKPGQIPPSRKYRVQQRVVWINRTGGNALIDIHCNSAGSRWRGPQTFYWNGKGSYYLAHDVQEELQFFTHTNRPVTRIDQYVLRYAKMPAINVEVGFISNPQEEKLLMNPQYQRQIAWYIFLGTERWFLKGHWPETLLQTPPPTHLLVRD